MNSLSKKIVRAAAAAAFSATVIGTVFTGAAGAAAGDPSQWGRSHQGGAVVGDPSQWISRKVNEYEGQHRKVNEYEGERKVNEYEGERKVNEYE